MTTARPRAMAWQGGAAPTAVRELTLDRAVRDWVLVPISVAMFLVGVLRHLGGKVRAPPSAGWGRAGRRGGWGPGACGRLAPFPSRLVERRGRPGLIGGADAREPQMMRPKAKAQVKSVAAVQTVLRAQRLRANAGWIPESGYKQRRQAFLDKDRGLLVQETEAPNPQQQMMNDPSMMSDMMMKNLNMIVPQVATGAWVSFFFSGFIVARVPFPLTQRFRVMLQRGVDLGSLDVTYISSLSWYFLNLFGLRGLLILVLGEVTFDDTQIMQQQMAMGMDAPNAFKTEKDQMELVTHRWILPQITERAEKTLARVAAAM